MAREMGFRFGGGGGGGSGSGGSSGSGAGSSNIRVSVRWFEQTVFAGDEIRCRITFANVAPKPSPPLMAQQQHPNQHQHQQPSLANRQPGSYHADRTRPSLVPAASSRLAPPPLPSTRRHQRASHSISGPAPSPTSAASAYATSASAAAARRRADSIPWSPNGGDGNNGNGNGNGSNNNGNGNGNTNGNTNGHGHGHGHSHRRSLSIVSISSAGTSDAPVASPTASGPPQLLIGPPGSQNRPVRGHLRASSLQIGRGSSFFGGPRSATNPPRAFSNQPSPLYNASFPPSDHSGRGASQRGRLIGSATMPNTPSIGSMSRVSPRLPPSDGFPDFTFPAAPVPAPAAAPTLTPIDGPLVASPSALAADDKPLPALPVRPRDLSDNNQPVPTIYEGPVAAAAAASPVEARVLSTTSIAGTPRSSGEFYSISNHSSETLASEYVSQQPSQSPAVPRSPSRPAAHARQKSAANLLSPPTYAGGSSYHAGPSLSQRARTTAAAAAAAAATAAASSAAAAGAAGAAGSAGGVVVAPETLMMGYAQVHGSFTLDGSLVDLGPFEQVKRRGVVGGQGGGVIGIEPTKRDSGLLRGFGWGQLASSLGDLLGGGEMSTIKEMRDLASTKAIPLLSTPQSVLFVDLRLAPGESKTYEYTFRLPKGLPPTHRGKLMKTTYSLVIGTQRPGTAREQRVHSVEMPFRVLGSVNSYGEILGHDLMAPYIPMQDKAIVHALSDKERHRPWAAAAQGGQDARRRRSSTAATVTDVSASLGGFMAYVDALLQQREDESSADANKNGRTAAAGDDDATGSRRSGLLSPSAVLSRRASASSIFWADDGAVAVATGGGGGGGGSMSFSSPDHPVLTLSSREAIDLAILRSNMSGGNHLSANRFEIARNGRRVGTVMVARPAYRLGETVTMVVDFAAADMRCYAVHAALETTEHIADPTLALRSEASIQRVTRKVYASLSEATLYARRFVFTATIPAGATPEFVTTGVSLDWKIRVEFVVPAEDVEDGQGGQDADGADGADAADRLASDDGGEYVIDDADTGESHTDDDDATDDSQRRRRRAGRRHSAVPSNTANNNHTRRPPPPPMLEAISRDDRGGLVLVAAETLRCESFEAAVPLRVYGWSGDAGGRDDRDDRDPGMAV